MLPPCCSDLRGALLALAAAYVADACGVRCRWLQAILAPICAAGLACSLSFYVHTTRVVFNRRPNWNPTAFWRHLMMTRPLEAMWRFLTVPLRVLPDFHVLGETRTGTTTFAAHLRDLGCVGPFCPWIVPLGSDKESFYFVGHYWGFVHPAAYRMCFPLKPAMWLRRSVLGQRPPVFDACASHLAAPWAAALLRRAAPEATLVAILRPPEEQNASWWRLEMGAHRWAKGMGMGTDFLLQGYPPRSFREALLLSRTPEVEAMYREGEAAAAEVLRGTAWSLPARLLPFPGGQLAAFTRMGRYVGNLRRYASHFGAQRLVVLETADLAQARRLAAAMERVAKVTPSLRDLLLRRARGGPGKPSGAAGEALQAWAAGRASSLRLNEPGSLPPELEPCPEDIEELKEFYQKENERLFEFLGRDLGWSSAKLSSACYRKLDATTLQRAGSSPGLMYARDM